mgnify:CR=1 FL=1
MLSDLLAELEVPEEQFLKVVKKGLNMKQHKKVFEQLLIADNFLVFKKIMVKRNKELELEALRQLEEQNQEHDLQLHTHHHAKHEASLNPEIERLNLEKEQAEIEEAITRSLALEQEKLRLRELEDKELQEALRQSQREFEIMQELENRKLQEEEKKKYLQQLNEAFLSEQMREKEKNMELRKEEEISNQQSPAEDKESEQLTINKGEQENHQDREAREKLNLEELPSVSDKKNSPKFDHLNQNIEESKEKLPEINHPKWKGVLPPIERRSYDAFSNEELLKEKEQIAQKLDNLDANKKLESTQESLEERKKRLQVLRDVILKKKQEEREAELRHYEKEQVKFNYYSLAYANVKKKTGKAFDRSAFC